MGIQSKEQGTLLASGRKLYQYAQCTILIRTAKATLVFLSVLFLSVGSVIVGPRMIILVHRSKVDIMWILCPKHGLNYPGRPMLKHQATMAVFSNIFGQSPILPSLSLNNLVFHLNIISVIFVPKIVHFNIYVYIKK